MIQTELDFETHNPPSNHTETSIAAARSQTRSKVASDRERILSYVKSRGGATRDQIEVGTWFNGNTVRPRVWELVRAGKLVETLEKRRTRTGSWALVLVAK